MIKFNKRSLLLLGILCVNINAIAKPFCAQKSPDEVFPCLKDQIKSHKPNPLSYVDLLTTLDDNLITVNQARELIKYGYEEETGNPVLFFKSKKVVIPEQYSLNFFWIHKDPLQTSGHLLGSNDQNLAKYVVNPLKDWQSKQPEANINFWYDGALVTEEHLTNTKKMLGENSDINIAKIRLRNIREIPFVQENKKLFELAIPVFYRVDLAKAVIADHVLRGDKLPFVVTIDNDIVAVSRAQLFDEHTMQALENIGYVLGTAGGAEEENSFIMLHNNDDLKTLENHRTYIIDAAAKEAQTLNYEHLGAQDVFQKYGDLKSVMRISFKNKTGKKWRSLGVQPTGKFMIFPPSQFGAFGGYSDDKIKLLRSALLDATNQNRALLAP